MRHDEAQRKPVARRKWLSIVVGREQNLLAIEIRQGNVGGESLLRVHPHVAHARLQSQPPKDFTKGHAVPQVAEPAPARQAVEVACPPDPGKCVELSPYPSQRCFHSAVRPELPALRIEVRHRAVVQNRPFQRERLAAGEGGPPASSSVRVPCVGCLRIASAPTSRSASGRESSLPDFDRRCTLA